MTVITALVSRYSDLCEGLGKLLDCIKEHDPSHRIWFTARQREKRALSDAVVNFDDRDLLEVLRILMNCGCDGKSCLVISEEKPEDWKYDKEDCLWNHRVIEPTWEFTIQDGGYID